MKNNRYFLYFIACISLSMGCEEVGFDTPESITPNQSKTFIKLYGGSADQEGADLHLTPDGGYVLLGSTASASGGLHQDMYLIRTDEFGNELWSNIFGGQGDDMGLSLQVLADGYALCGYSTNLAGYTDVYVVKTDLAGNESWAYTYGFEESHEVGTRIQTTTDGGFLIIGHTTNIDTAKGIGTGTTDSLDIYSIKIDGQGNKQWERISGILGTDEGIGAVETETGYLLLGTSPRSAIDQNGLNFLLIQTTLAGIAINVRSYGGVTDEIARDIRKTQDGGFMLMGTEINGSQRNICLLKLDANQNELWRNTIVADGQLEAHTIQEIADGFILSGTVQNGHSDVYVNRTDAQGNSIWAKNMGRSGEDYGGAIVQHPEGGFVVTGTQYFGTNSMVSLVKMTSEGELNPK